MIVQDVALCYKVIQARTLETKDDNSLWTIIIVYMYANGKHDHGN